MNSVIDSALDTYLEAYRGLIATEKNGNSMVLSFPLHLAANHRIEVTVTDLGKHKCVLSDSARTLGEVQAAGYSLSSQMKERIEKLASLSGLRVLDKHLVLECSYSDIGVSIQKFLEATKTIGDIYLVHRQHPAPSEDLVAEVRAVLDSQNVLYRVGEKIQGEIELHPFQIVIPSNGRPGMALSVLVGQNTHSIAQIWGYKCEDIRREQANKNTKLALVYDVRFETWSDASRAILESRADVAIPSDSIVRMPAQLEQQGIVKTQRKA